MAVLVRLAHARLFDLDAEARPFWHRQITVDRRQGFLVGAEVQEVVTAGIVMDAEADLLDRMVRRAGRDLQASTEGQRTERAMGSHCDVVGLCHGCDLAY